MNKIEEYNQILEYICIYGNINKKKIKGRKRKKPGKYIKIKETLKLEDKDLFALALLENNL